MLNWLFLLFSLFSFADSADTVGLDGSGSGGKSNRIPVYIAVESLAPGTIPGEGGILETIYESGRVWALVEDVGEKALRVTLDEPIVLERNKSSETVTQFGRVSSFVITSGNWNSSTHSAFLDSQVGEAFHTKGNTPEEIRELVSKVEAGETDKMLDRMTLANLPELRTFAGMTFTIGAEDLIRKGPIPVQSLKALAYEITPVVGTYETIQPIDFLRFGDPKGAWSPELIESYLQAQEELWKQYKDKQRFQAKTSSWWLARENSPSPADVAAQQIGLKPVESEGQSENFKKSPLWVAHENSEPVKKERPSGTSQPMETASPEHKDSVNPSSRRVLRHKGNPNTLYLRLSTEDKPQPAKDEVTRLVETSSNVTRFVVSCRKTFAKN